MPDIKVKDPNSLKVEIEGRVYDLSKIPEYKDLLVQKEVANVLNQLSLKDITENLYLTVELFYVAFNGVAGARGGTIQAEITSIQSDLALLCNECVETMTSFKEETGNILTLLCDMYRWLTQGKENLAIKKLAHCSESSATMSEAANRLAEKFKELQIRSTKARSNTIEEEASEQDKKLAAEKAERELKAKQEAEKISQQELVAQIGEIQQRYDEAKAREEKEATKALLLGITNAIATSVSAGLGAFVAAKNPISTAISGTVSSMELSKAQKDANDKKALSDKAQQDLLTAKDDQTKKKNRVDSLTTEIAALNKQISENEKNQEALAKLKPQLETKNGELIKAKDELKATDSKVEELQKVSSNSTATYTAAAASLQDLAKSTGQMSQAATNAEESIHAEKMSYLNQKLNLEKQKRESLVALAQYAETVKNLKADESMAAVSVNSLHAAVEALGKIIATLTNASLFWDQMSSFCKKMTDKSFQQDLKDLIAPDSGLSQEERIEEYKSFEFMRNFLGYMCQWVAINGLSGDYLETAGKAQKLAVEYLKQSPTIEEALKKAPELAKNMELMLNKNLLESGKVIADLEQQKSLIENKKS